MIFVGFWIFYGVVDIVTSVIKKENINVQTIYLILGMSIMFFSAQNHYRNSKTQDNQSNEKTIKQFVHRPTLYIFIGLFISLLVFVITFYGEKEVTVEIIDSENTPKQVAEIINTKGKEFELLTFEHDDWTYLYYRIPLGYYSIEIKVTDKKDHYLAHSIVNYATDEQYVDTERIVRFRPTEEKSLQLKETIRVPELIKIIMKEESDSN